MTLSAPFFISMRPSNEESPAPAQETFELKSSLWSIQMLAGTPPLMPSMLMASDASPPGSRPKVMLRTMMLLDDEAMWMPKLAAEPSAPSRVMSFFFLISTICAARFHCVQGSGMLAKSNVPV